MNFVVLKLTLEILSMKISKHTYIYGRYLFPTFYLITNGIFDCFKTSQFTTQIFVVVFFLFFFLFFFFLLLLLLLCSFLFVCLFFYLFVCCFFFVFFFCSVISTSKVTFRWSIVTQNHSFPPFSSSSNPGPPIGAPPVSRSNPSSPGRFDNMSHDMTEPTKWL